ncbi:hypothetical protein [Adhaeribacter aquaticus]|uniref:hypothetical protein n=1 Tax=Adhaeribacter aquaticus TaxID=299567 RepID=UPI00047CF823|nr:hypothetical protein [Adhaeribacter aquaticus]
MQDRIKIPGDATEKNYNLILLKLDRTFQKFKEKFPELVDLEFKINTILLDSSQINPFYYRLQNICHLLHIEAQHSYVIRHIHHNLCKDVENLANKLHDLEETELYLDIA